MSLSKTVSLTEKMGQMLIVGFKGTAIKDNDFIAEAIVNKAIGGVILFDYDFPSKTYDHNIQSPEQVKKLTQQLQHYAHQVDSLPLFISVDYEGGNVNRLKELYGFPKTLSAAAIGKETEEKAYQHATQMASTLKAVGINLNFAPLVDVNTNPENPVIGKLERSFSHNPEIVTTFATIFSKVYQDHGILSVYKHFPGHGSSTHDSHDGFVDVTDTWQELELIPYQQLFKKDYAHPIVMTSHVAHFGLDNEGYPASLSKAMTDTLLRKKLNFNGVVVTDDLQMKAISANYGKELAIELAINAGADILIFGNQLTEAQNPQEIISIIQQKVNDGKISEQRINESYNRIIKLKAFLS